MTGRDVQARVDALESKIDTLPTMIAWGLAVLGLLMAALRLFGGRGAARAGQRNRHGSAVD